MIDDIHGPPDADISIQQLRAFVAVIDAGSVTGAAKQLGLTQPTVSHALAALERALAAQLCRRDRDGIALSEMGELIIAHARTTLGHVKAIREVALQYSGLEAGQVRIGSVPSAAANLLPALLRLFRRRYPGIKLVLLEGSDQEVQEWLLRRSVDVGFGQIGAPELRTLAVATDDFVAVLPARHRLASRAAVTIRDLSGEPFLLSAGGCAPAIRTLFAHARARLEIAHEIRDMAALLAMVREGLGVTIVPSLALPAKSAGLAGLPLSPHTRRTLSVAWHRTGALPGAVAAFLACVRTHARAQRGPATTPSDGPCRT